MARRISPPSRPASTAEPTLGEQFRSAPPVERVRPLFPTGPHALHLTPRQLRTHNRLSKAKRAWHTAKTPAERTHILQEFALAIAARQAHGLDVVKLDRLSGTTRDVLELVERAERGRWALHSIEERLDTSSPHGRFVVTVLAALAQMEREQASSRTKAALGHLRATRQRYSGRLPFGYCLAGDGQHLEADPQEQATLVLIRALAPGRSLRALAAEPARRGVLARCGKPFQARTLARLVTDRAVSHGGPAETLSHTPSDEAEAAA
jgi:DNA invertase Pin-like site-specific DNA recombinase